MISVEVKGDFSNLRKFLKRRKYDSILKKYGELGVSLLRGATPKRTGKTSESWSYKISTDENILQLGSSRQEEKEESKRLERQEKQNLCLLWRALCRKT